MMTETPLPDHCKPAFAEAELVAVLRTLPDERARLAARFVVQIAAVHDPDVVETFLAWRADPRLDTLLLLASQLQGDALDQVLFLTEDISMESENKHDSDQRGLKE